MTVDEESVSPKKCDLWTLILKNPDLLLAIRRLDNKDAGDGESRVRGDLAPSLERRALLQTKLESGLMTPQEFKNEFNVHLAGLVERTLRSFSESNEVTLSYQSSLHDFPDSLGQSGARELLERVKRIKGIRAILFGSTTINHRNEEKSIDNG